MRSKYAVKPHIKPVYDMIMLLLRPYLWLKYRFRVPKDIPALPDGPIVLLGSHTGNLDFLLHWQRSGKSGSMPLWRRTFTATAA